MPEIATTKATTPLVTKPVTPSSIRFIGCGGCGTNLVAPFNRSRNKEVPGFATVQTCFIDTSRSNLDESIPDQDIFLFEGTNGSGKVQSANYEVIAERRLEILNKFKLADMNVFVHGGSGGSGATIAQVLLNEALQRGANAIVVCVGNTSSRIEVQNTIETLERYEAMVERRQRPVNVYYRENSPTTPRGEVDKDVHSFLVMASILFSGQNRELDNEDVKNFLDYNQVTSFQPMLSGLEVLNNSSQLRPNEVVCTMATLTDVETSGEPMVPCVYQSVGFIPAVLKSNMKAPLPLHFCTVGGYFNSTIKRLEGLLKDYDESLKAVNIKGILHGKTKGAGFMDF